MPIIRTRRTPPTETAEVVDRKAIHERKAEESPLVIIPKEDAQILQRVAAGDIPEHAVMDVFPAMNRGIARAYATNTVARYNEVLIQALARKGVDIDLVAEKIAEQMEARKPLEYRGELTGDSVEDGAARRWAVDTVLDILPGARAPKEMKIEKTSLEAIILRIQDEGRDDDE